MPSLPGTTASTSGNSYPDPSDRNSKMIPIKCPHLETYIKINPRTNDAEIVWKLMENSTKKDAVEPLKLDEPIHPNKVIILRIQTN